MEVCLGLGLEMLNSRETPLQATCLVGELYRQSVLALASEKPVLLLDPVQLEVATA